jgi:DNA-binding HxlR family transcriptional regulator
MPEFKFRDKVYNNPVELALEVLGGKWKMPILWRVKDKPWRYGELKKSLGKITHKMLTQQLRELEADGLVHRKVFAEVPPRVEYTITENGETVIPIIKALQKWGYDFMNKQ